jgi:DNA-binding response OmpR family regulator
MCLVAMAISGDVKLSVCRALQERFRTSVLTPTNGVSMSATQLSVLLLVEDEALILVEVEDTLKEAGFEPIAARDGHSAMNEIEKDCSRFSAIVTDVDLGIGPSGWEIARRARQLLSNIPVVYMSGASHADWSAQGVPKSIMLAKPFASIQLVTAVATLITEAAMSSDLA